MRPPELASIRPHLEQAVGDIDYFLTVLEEQEIDKRVWSKLYDFLEAGWTPPKVNARGKNRLTKTQYMALVYRTKLRRRKRPDEPLDERQGKPLTDEEREAILADLDQGEPLSDAGREALAFWARGGWLESSRQMAVRLRNAGETVAADEINEALRPLCDEPRDAAERSGYREAMRTAAEYVRTILTTCLEEQAPAAPEPQRPAAKSSEAAGTDFRSMRWGDNLFSFTANQAPVMRLLYENRKAGTPDVGDETLLSAVDPEAPPARLSTLFRDHCAWGTLIVPGGSKGSHRLADPDT